MIDYKFAEYFQVSIYMKIQIRYFCEDAKQSQSITNDDEKMPQIDKFKFIPKI